MPIEVGIWRIEDQLRKVAFSPMEAESKLEDTLEQDITILSPDLMLIGRQVPTAHGKFIDLLAMDNEGNLCVIELKKHKTPRDVVAQLLDYASWVQTLSYSDIAEIYAERNQGKEFERGFAEVFDTSPPDKLNEHLQLIVVAAEIDHASERIINYLSDNFGVPINAVFFRYFRDGDSEYLARTWLIDPREAEIKISKSSSKKGEEAWNGMDYYVAYGEAEDSDLVWEDGRKYGFVAADGGRWYTRTLDLLSPGSRVFVYIPKSGYVGVGKVLESVKPAKEFTVTVDGQAVNVYQASLLGGYQQNNVDDQEKCAYFVRVEWLKTVSREQAFWAKGMYANQNTVTKLRNKFTLERLVEHFNLESE